MKAENFYRAKVLAGFVAFINAVGWLWFAPELNMLWNIYSLGITAIFLTAALLPAKVYSSGSHSWIGLIYISGFVISVPIIYEMLTPKRGPEYGGLVLQLAMLVLLGYFAVAAFKKTT